MPDSSDPRTPAPEPGPQEPQPPYAAPTPPDAQSSWTPPTTPPGQPWSGWTQGAPGGQVPPAGWTGPATPPTTWRVPDVKPGVIALRPLGAGEIVDGAITTVRKNPMATIGLAAIVGVVAGMIGLAVSWFVSQQAALVDPSATTDELLDALAVTLPVLGVGLLATWLATVFLTGLLTVVVGQAVIGRDLTIGEAWARARPRLWRLIGLTIVYALIWLGALTGVIILASVLGALIGGGAGAGVVVLGLFAAAALGAWLYVRYNLSVPSLMLESETFGSGTRPVRLGRSLGRSAGLVQGSWWRTFGILLMITIIGVIVTFAVTAPFQLIAGETLTDPTSVTEIGFGGQVLISIGQVAATAIASPFVAAATVLLYIDLRIRREGLDLELARAAGVTLPHRDAPYGRPGAPGQAWTQPGASGHPWTQPGPSNQPPPAPSPPPDDPPSAWPPR